MDFLNGTALVVSITVGLASLAQPPNDSVLIDTQGNKYSIRVMNDGNVWMTTNLKLNIAASYCYENMPENCDQFGRLYTFKAAKNGCRLLAEGWRLPTTEEWQQLAILYAPGAKDSVEARKKAFQSLLVNGNDSFMALLGGGRDQSGGYARVNAHGFYWTATEADSATAWFANFAKGSGSLFVQTGGEKDRAFSVRCVKGISK